MRRLVVVTAALVLLAGASEAAAETRIVSGPLPNSYLNPNVTMPRGDSATLLNLDLLAPHNMRSEKMIGRRRHRRPLFLTQTIGFARQAPVPGPPI